MAKVLYCNDLIPGCKFEARGESDEEVLGEIADHLALAHNLLDFSEEIERMISKAIQEEFRVRAARV